MANFQKEKNPQKDCMGQETKEKGKERRHEKWDRKDISRGRRWYSTTTRILRGKKGAESRITVLLFFLITAHFENVGNYRPSPIKWVCLHHIPGAHELQVENSWSIQKSGAKRKVQRGGKMERRIESATGKEVRAEWRAGMLPPQPHAPRLTLG